MKSDRIFHVIIVVFCCLSTVYSFGNYSWNNPSSNLPQGCEHHTYHSELMNIDIGYCIYLPPDYSTTDALYPVVYSLHGMGGNENSNCQAYADVLRSGIGANDFPPVIVVFVNGRGNTFYSNSKDGSVKCESSIIRELIPHIDQTYRTMENRTKRAIEGISMGGFGALMLGFKHPDLFTSIGSYDAALVNWDTLSEQQFDQSIPTQIFGSDEQYFNENSYPFTFARRNAETITSLGINVRMVTGDNDVQMGPLHNYNLAMRDTLNTLGIDLDFNTIPGGRHGDGMNATTIKENLLFHTANFASTALRHTNMPSPAKDTRNRLVTFSIFSSFRLPYEWSRSTGTVTLYRFDGKCAGVVHCNGRGIADGTGVRKIFASGKYLAKIP